MAAEVTHPLTVQPSASTDGERSRDERVAAALPPSAAADRTLDGMRAAQSASALRRELEAETDAARRAALSFELARLAETTNDLGAAARDALAATNLAAGFTEPLEMLLRIAERRHSTGNSEKLLERLLRVAKTEPERQRAGLELLAHLLVRGDDEGARSLLGELERTSPDDPTLRLIRRELAALRGDAREKTIALVERSQTTSDARLRAELLALAAGESATLGDHDEALALLTEALDAAPTYRRAEELAKLAVRAERFELAVDAVDRLLELVREARADETRAELLAVSGDELGAANERALILRSVVLSLRAERAEEALSRLVGFGSETAADLFLAAVTRLASSLSAEDENGKRARQIALLTAVLENDAASDRTSRLTPKDRGGLHLVVGYLAEGADDLARAETHYREAVRDLPGGVLPEVLLARSLARTASAREEGDARRAQLEELRQLADRIAARGRHESGTTRAELLAASALLAAHDDAGLAMRRLEEARDVGLSSNVMRRLLRVLALLGGREKLVLAADLALLEHESAEGRGDAAQGRDQALFEEALSLALSTDSIDALARLLAELPDADFGRLLVSGFLARERDDAGAHAPRFPEALVSALRDDDVPAERRRALSLVQVARELRTGSPEARGVALGRLRTLWEAEPSDPVVTSALTELLRADDPARSGRAFSRAAEEATHPDLRELWSLEAALALFRAGRHHEVVEALDRAGAPGQTALGDLELLFLRALGPPGEARRRIAARRFAEDGDVEAALAFATEHLAAREEAREVLRRALERAVEMGASDGLGPAALLTALLDPPEALSEGPSVPGVSDGLDAEERALLGLVGARDEDADRQVDRALDWLAAARENDGAARENDGAARENDGAPQLDAALGTLVLARIAERSEEEAIALEELGRVLDEPLLVGAALERRGDHAGSGEATAARLFRLHPRSVELGWLALETTAPGSHDERLESLTKLAEALGTEASASQEGASASQEGAAKAEVDPDASALELVAAYHHLGRGEPDRALPLFLRLVELLPQDPSVLLGLERTARSVDRPDLEAMALRARAERSADDERAAMLWQRAGDLERDRLGQLDEAERCYRSALARHPENAGAFQRLYRLTRSRGDKPRLLELIDARLDVGLSAESRAELLWEKARLSKNAGRRPSALRALEQLIELEPAHLRAWALAAEIHLVDGRLERAAEALRAVALHDDASLPEAEALGVQAADLFERLHRPREAVELLEALAARGVERSSLAARRARAAARAGQWEVAYLAALEWNESSDDVAERLGSAKMMLALQRDHLKEPFAAENAAERILRDAPLDPDAVDAVLGGSFAPDDRARLLAAPLEESVRILRDTPLQAGELARFLELAEATSSKSWLRIAVGAGSLVARLDDEKKKFLEESLRHFSVVPSFPFATEDWQKIASPGAVGPAGRFAWLLGPHVDELTAPELDELGLGPALRIDPFGDHPLRREIGAWTTWFGVPDFELYVGGDDPHRALALGRDFVTVVLGEAAEEALGVRERARLASSLYVLHERIAPFVNLPEEEARSWIQAALAAIGTSPAGGTDAPGVRERADALAARLGREEREEMREQAELVAARGGDLTRFTLVARSSAARFVTLLAGEPSILRHLPRLLPVDADDRKKLLSDVFRFALSTEFPLLRRKAGLERP